MANKNTTPATMNTPATTKTTPTKEGTIMSNINVTIKTKSRYFTLTDNLGNEIMRVYPSSKNSATGFITNIYAEVFESVSHTRKLFAPEKYTREFRIKLSDAAKADDNINLSDAVMLYAAEALKYGVEFEEPVEA